MVDINNFITSLKCSLIKMFIKSFKPWMIFYLPSMVKISFYRNYTVLEILFLKCLHKETIPFKRCFQFLQYILLHVYKAINNVGVRLGSII